MHSIWTALGFSLWLERFGMEIVDVLSEIESLQRRKEGLIEGHLIEVLIRDSVCLSHF